MKNLLLSIPLALGMSAAADRLAAEEETYLRLKPAKCVALRKGQICYQRLKVSFGTKVQGDFCIHVDDEKRPLKCWKNLSKGTFSYDFNSPESADFRLLDASGKQLANSQFTVAWVYNNRTKRRGSWRLF